ncbi:MAG: hypothetical protein JTT17_07200 [Candidatus Brockarchaeota archaeon]|nr:hypothetical protein [Candidatus Brockarchaeota archaeon]
MPESLLKHDPLSMLATSLRVNIVASGLIETEYSRSSKEYRELRVD